jgi:hypothetical protein
VVFSELHASNVQDGHRRPSRKWHPAQWCCGGALVVQRQILLRHHASAHREVPSGHAFDPKSEIGVLDILHADVRWSSGSREVIEKRLAKITSSLVQQFEWRPLVVPEGHTAADALKHMLSLQCNGGDKSLQPSAFEYSWSIVHVQAEGAKTGQLVGGASFDNCIEEVSCDDDGEKELVTFKPYQYCEAIAAQVERYWQRAADAFVTYAPAHIDGPGVCGVRSASDDTDGSTAGSSSSRATKMPRTGSAELDPLVRLNVPKASSFHHASCNAAL